MNKVFTRLFFIFSIIWGVGYPVPFRIPLYILISPLVFCTALNYKKINFFNIKNYTSLFKKKLITSKILYLLIPAVFYFFIWDRQSILYLIFLIIFVLVSRNFLDYKNIEEKDWIYKSLVILILFLGLSLPFVCSFHENVSASQGLYPEPSNLGFSLGPVLGVLTRRKKYRFFGFFE